MNAGRLSKKTVNVILTGNAIKQHLGLALSAEEGTWKPNSKGATRAVRSDRMDAGIGGWPR